MARFTGKVIGPFFAIILVASIARAAQPPAETIGTPLPAGQVLEKMQCVSDSSQTYALYLPSHYHPDKPWPIIYAFDPLARGKLPVNLYKEEAEKYGYILAASNNSRNFQADAVSKTAQAVWEDTHARLKLDPKRIYMMGFSGGARVATTLAIHCENCAVAGVIAHGAGYPSSSPPTVKDRFAYFALVGDKDFNWPELIALRSKKEEWPAPFRLRVYPGEHQWAPPDILDEALQWLQLKSMQTGTTPHDPAFIDRFFAKTQKEAEDASQRKDPIAQFEAYRSLVADFTGLKDVTRYQAELPAIRNSAELKRACKKENEVIDQQRALTQPLSASLSQLSEADPSLLPALRNRIIDGMNALRSQANHAKKEETRLVDLRAFNELWAEGIEAGQSEMEIHKRFAIAESYFQLMSAISPNEPWPVLLLAEADALQGDRKRALKNLHEAVQRGLKNPSSLADNANLQTLRSEPEFQQIVAALKAASEARQ